mmetsp:Transcript_27676/g.41893  ORF Transcript_27676/g.41893 Transcript_27676/m.41893 type:complete len:229 (+) Transcript_27676:73-759(+)|eukprot:CAMPEP_0178923078 /NCGR_PEP_ID=MMETSP0786-20121207/16517_1 /TAXON_ID=186022 /ORGANISM="Thalassionema frauenfeldii, Strain CCMP 1798" /LENGTH=228 /DNA_ID=CAMNT_0020597529 /DNA_START=20 /DNA_END=706 /DNA_ORIENTATION=-
MSASSTSNGKNARSVVTLGIAGGSGGGKTTLARAIAKALGGNDEVVYLSHDYYYKDLSHKRVEERVQTNFDHPDSLDTGLMIEHVKELRKGNAIQVPTYCFKTHCRMEEIKHVTPKPITIVEGILIFTDVDLRKELDLMVYVDADADVRLSRRLERDINERGRSFESVIKQYHATVRSMHAEWVEPSKKFADLVVQTSDHSLDIAVKTLTNHLRAEASGINLERNDGN